MYQTKNADKPFFVKIIKGGFVMSLNINVKKVKMCVTCKLWNGDAVIDYNARIGVLRFDDRMDAYCDFWKVKKRAVHHCHKYQIEYRYI